MKLGFLEIPSDERRLYIEQAALRRNTRPPQPGRRMEKPVLWQFVGELRQSNPWDISSRSTCGAATRVTPRLSGHAGHVSL